MVEMRNVSFSYGERVVLEQIQLNMKKGAWLSIVGENGSGKSTLARLVAGLLLPTAGTLRVCGFDTAKDAERGALRQKIAYVFQNPENQIVGTTVEEDIAFGAENLGLPREEILARTDDALTRFALTNLRRKEPHLLSGGEMQRTALAGAYVMRPELLILDEACAQLDPQNRRQIWEHIAALKEETGLTVVSVSHYVDELRFGDQLLFLKDKTAEVVEG
ncbi:MAG TPA: ATP-binding cassette domain-containing protein [Clostridiales bacterium]|nr:ATP-binding cassette domain-containing protein [Clostridiales bacterium]